ncbi:unnamed protein product [Parnassius mnemosyne]|uniref:Chitin-binding type-2 domain-containing protein n=1 Tax=Parnassius mnemosyne TaxID=213953 RepID=A0AAV1K6J3_9NEOP
MDNILLFLTPLLLYPLLIEAKNINCNSKSFHCVNSTHFMICVDLGGGVSMTIDSFVIRCPPTTFCQETNYFECEYQASTTQKTKFDVTNGFADTNTLTATTETISSEVYQVYINGVNNAVTELVPNELDSEAIKVQDITTSLPNTQKSSLIKYAPTTLSVTVNVLTGVNTQVESKKISTISQYYDVFVDSNKKINTLSNKTLKQYCLNDTISNISLKNKLTATEANYKSTRDSVETTNKLLTTINKINNSYDEHNPTELVLKYKQQIIPTDKSYFAVNPFVYGYEINLTSEGNFNNVSTKIQSKEDKISDDRSFSYFTLYNNVSKSDTIYNNDLVKSVKGRKIITSIKTSRNHKQLLPNTLESVELDDSSKVNKPIFNFNCRNRSRGRFADEGNCRKFYICIGIVAPILGLCPINTVFSEFQQQCTRNLSHCVRKNQFQCVSEGRFIDVWEDNIYYICVKGTDHRFIRFKLQCQNGYRLDKMSLTCKNVKEIIKLSSSSLSSSLYDEDNKKISKTITKKRTDKNLFINNESFKCEKEGKFSDPSNCRRYYVCTKTSKSILRRKRKSCDSYEVFDKDKNKCVDQDSHEC